MKDTHDKYSSLLSIRCTFFLKHIISLDNYQRDLHSGKCTKRLMPGKGGKNSKTMSELSRNFTKYFLSHVIVVVCKVIYDFYEAKRGLLEDLYV